jgi:hypothetical protein
MKTNTKNKTLPKKAKSKTVANKGREGACLWITDVVKCGDGGVTVTVSCGDGLGVESPDMKAKKGKAKSMKTESATTSVRATITFPTELYETLEEIAKQKKVSLAWVVREAAEQYLTDKYPLFRGQA